MIRSSIPLLLAQKDLKTIVRSRALLAALVIYPLVIAVLLITLLKNTDQERTIALVNQDSSGRSIKVDDNEFSLDYYRRQAERSGTTVEEIPFDTAMHRLKEEQVNGVLVVPPGFFGTLGSGVDSSTLDFYTGRSIASDLITARVKGSIFQLNLSISQAYVEQNAAYLKQLVTGGEVNLGDETLNLLGLEPTEERLIAMRDQVDEDSQKDIDEIIEFAGQTKLALGLANGSMKAVRAPIRMKHIREKGKSPLFTARGISFALAVAIAFICTLLVSTLLAMERDEHVMGRLLRGVAHPWQIVVGKLVAGSILASIFTSALFILFIVQAPYSWTRLPLLLYAVWLSAFAFSTIGTLIATITRDARTATLCGLLVVLPMVPLALLHGHGSSELLSQILPFEPSEQLFNAMLFDGETLEPLIRGTLQLGAMSLVGGGLTLKLLRRLS